MVQAAGAHQLRTPLAGKPGSGADSDSDMWAVVVLGILTAIFAWFWFGGSGVKQEGETQTQQQEREEVTTPNTANSGAESSASGHGRITAQRSCGGGRLNAPAPGKGELLAKVQEEPPESVLEREDCHTGGRPDNVPGEKCVQNKEQGRSEKEEVQTNVDVYPTDVPKKEEVQTSRVEVYPTDVPKKEEVQTSRVEVYPTDVPKKEEVQTSRVEVYPTDVPKKEEVQTSRVEVYPTDVPKKEEVQTSRVEVYPTDVQEKPHALTNVDYPTDVPGKQEIQNNVEDYPADVPEKEEAQTNVEDYPTNVPEKWDMQNNVEDNPADVPGKEAVQTNREVVYHLDISEKDRLQINGVEPCHSSVSEQEKVHPKNVQKDGLVHVHGGEESQVNTQEEENTTGCFRENSLTLTNKENAVNVMEAAKERELKAEYDLFDNQDLSLKDINVTSGRYNRFSEQLGLVKHESFEQLKTVPALSKELRNRSDIGEPVTGLSDDTDVSTNSLSSETTLEGLASTQIVGDATLQTKTSAIVDKFTLVLPLSNQEEESPALKGSSVGEKAWFGSPLEAKIQEADYPKAKRVAAIQPMPQTVNFGFKVHYITISDSQIIAVTGDHEKLGGWVAYVPLTPVKDGFWSHSVSLPADTNVEWKFVMVENGKIKRWEECNNRCVQTAHEDTEAQQWWGCP